MPGAWKPTKNDPIFQTINCCEFCQQLIQPGEVIVVCPKCKATCHKECWQSNEDKCPILGCDCREPVTELPVLIRQPARIPRPAPAVPPERTQPGPYPTRYPRSEYVRRAPVHTPEQPRHYTPVVKSDTERSFMKSFTGKAIVIMALVVMACCSCLAAYYVYLIFINPSSG
jgi:hypothetical protein